MKMSTLLVVVGLGAVLAAGGVSFWTGLQAKADLRRDVVAQCHRQTGAYAVDLPTHIPVFQFCSCVTGQFERNLQSFRMGAPLKYIAEPEAHVTATLIASLYACRRRG